MTSLQYPNPQSFAASLRLRLKALPATSALAVVEGTSDKQMLSSLLHNSARTVATTGKDLVIQSRNHLSIDERNRMVFIVDCDGAVDASWLSDGDVVVSGFRDLDADLAYLLGTLDTLYWEFTSSTDVSSLEARVQTQEAVEFTQQLSTRFGIVLNAARSLEVPVRRTIRGRRVRVRLADLKELATWAKPRRLPSEADLANAVSEFLRWPAGTAGLVIAESQNRAQKHCRKHASADCAPCAVRTFSNGHDIADVAAAVLAGLTNSTFGTTEVERMIRVARRSRGPEDWPVIMRLRARESALGLRLLA